MSGSRSTPTTPFGQRATTPFGHRESVTTMIFHDAMHINNETAIAIHSYIPGSTFAMNDSGPSIRAGDKVILEFGDLTDHGYTSVTTQLKTKELENILCNTPEELLLHFKDTLDLYKSGRTPVSVSMEMERRGTTTTDLINYLINEERASPPALEAPGPHARSLGRGGSGEGAARGHY